MKTLFQMILGCCIILCSCQRPLPEATLLEEELALFPDYREVTIPHNIAPLNFKLRTAEPSILVLSCGEDQVRIDTEDGVFQFSEKEWKAFMNKVKGQQVKADIYINRNEKWYLTPSFNFEVSNDAIDAYLVYRRIAPGYRMWNEMGIYQRHLESFTETTFLSNKQTNNNCINCHSFNQQDAKQMLFHQRKTHGGTYFVRNGEIEKLNTKFCDSIATLVYPFWHPSGKYVAFSTNETHQDFHLNDPNRIEVYDNQSNVVIYDIEKHEVLVAPHLFSNENLETFPSFSPDGKELYFCSAPSKAMPDSYRDIKYNLLRVSFDPVNRTIGTKIDTLYNAAKEGRSVRFPRISPDGSHLMYTVSDYGNFSIWHKDADLRLLNLKTGETNCMELVNSKDVESYHSWSSNGYWFVFSSRREDGLYTRPYIAHIDKDGNLSKPFLLPQANPDYYDLSLFSFNIPELVKNAIEVDNYELVQTSKYGKATKIK